MGTVSTQFDVPCTHDKAILAIQDTVDRLEWKVLDLSATRVVTTCPGMPNQFWNFPKLTANLSDRGDRTRISVSVSMVGPTGGKKHLTGLMGQFVNSVSLRVQTNSIAINPTVAIGEGQDGPSPTSNGSDRLSQLERLTALRGSGVLTDEEFESEKQRILHQA